MSARGTQQRKRRFFRRLRQAVGCENCPCRTGEFRFYVPRWRGDPPPASVSSLISQGASWERIWPVAMKSKVYCLDCYHAAVALLRTRPGNAARASRRRQARQLKRAYQSPAAREWQQKRDEWAQFRQILSPEDVLTAQRMPLERRLEWCRERRPYV